MKKGKVGVVVLLVLLLISCSYASDDHQHKRRKSILSEPLVLNRVRSSVVFPIHGNVYPDGHYNVTLHIGQPPKPYFLDPDTGSDLTWLQCDAPCVRCTEAPHPYYKPTNDLVVCEDPICVSVQSPEHHNCENPNDQCDYDVKYGDDGESRGVLVKDVLPLTLTNRSRISPRLALGCGYHQTPGKYDFRPFDGVLGLGKGKSSIVSQLNNQGVIRNVVGHCLSREGGGFLFFGDDLYDSSSVVWTPMSPSTHYSPGLAELILGGKTTKFKKLEVVFDSGATYTYLNSMAYQALISWVKKELSRSPLREEPDDLPLCWKDHTHIKNIGDLRKYFKPLALSFKNGQKAKPRFELPPEDYLIISKKGNVCLGILNGTEAGQENTNIIGDISMQDKTVICDNEKQMIGWVVPADCNQIPNFQAVIM